MSLETMIADDNAAIAAAQAAVDAANAALQAAQGKLATDQKALADAQPVIALVGQLEASATVLDDATRTALLNLTAQIKALF